MKACPQQEAESMRTKIRVSLGIPLLLCASLASADPWKNESGHPGKGAKHRAPATQHESWFHQHGYTRLDIPPGQYPPPGHCRIWFPDRPPGHQPPPERCHGAGVPPGAWLIRHPADRPDHVHISVYDPHDPGSIQVVGEFEIGSGLFIRLVLD
jgi:hypothetical protein